MDLRLQLPILCALLSALSGCQAGAESRAVDICSKQAPQIEAGRDPSVKGTIVRSFETREVKSGHYLVIVNYQVATMANPNPDIKDFMSISTLTCEIKDGEIIDGAILGTKGDQILRRFKR